METWDAIRARRATKEYDSRPLSKEDLEQILEAGRRAPSAGNRQDWDFILIQPSDYTDEQNQKLSAAYKKLGVPGGGKFFLSIRQYLLEHSDTVADKTTAAEWLKQLQ